LMIAEFISIDIKIMDINVLEGHRLIDDVIHCPKETCSSSRKRRATTKAMNRKERTCYPTIRN
jgi:hypothetical protein